MDGNRSFSAEQVSPTDWELAPDSMKQLVEELLSWMRDRQMFPARDDRLAQFFDALPLGISVHDAAGTMVYVNRSGRLILQIDRADPTSIERMPSMFQVFRRATQTPYPTAELPIVKALAGESAYADDLEIHLPDRAVPLEVWATAFRDESGQVTHAIAAFQDATNRQHLERERQQAVAACQRSEARFRAITANLPGVIYQYMLYADGSQGFTYVSPSIHSLYGLAPEEVLADASVMWQRVYPEDVARLEATIAESAQRLQPWVSEHRIVTASGELKWVRGSAQPQRLPGGDIVWDGILIDISDRKRTEEELHRTVTRNQALIDAIPDLILRVGRDGTYLDGVTKEHASLLLPWDRIVGRNVRDVLPSDIAAQRMRCVEAAFTTGEVQVQEYSLFVRGEWRDEEARIVTSGEDEAIVLVRDITERKRAELQLFESERRFRSLFESTDKIAVQGYDRDRKVIYWNDASEYLYGYSWHEALGQQLEDLIIPPEMQQDVIAAIDRWVREGIEIPAAELSLRRKDGSRVWVYSNHIMLYNIAGEPEMYCVDIDLTELKAAEEQLRKTDADRQLILELTGIGTWDWNLVADELIWSENTASLLGLNLSEIQTSFELFLSRVHPADRDRIRRGVETALSNHTDLSVEYRVPQPDGRDRWVQAKGKGLYDETGRPIRMVGVVFDTTDRKHAEEKLREQQAQLDLVVQASNVGFYLSDLKAKTSYVSPPYKAQLGYPADASEASPNDWRDRLHPEDRDRAVAAYQAFLRQEASYSLDFRLRHRDGSYRWIYSNAHLICDETGHPIKVVGTHVDITDRKEAEVALQESERRFRNLAANIPGAIFRYLLRADGTDAVLYMSPGCLNLWELDAKDVERDASPLWVMVHPDDLPAMAHSVRESAQTLQPWAWEWRIIPPSGRVKWLQAAGQPQRLPNGDTVWDSMILDISDRKQAEDALKAENAFRTQLIEQMGEGVAVCCAIPDFPYVRFTVWNRRMEEMVGYTLEEINRLGWYQTLYPDPELQERAIERMERMRQGDNLQNEEWEVVCADGTKRVLSISTSIIFERDTPYVLAVMRDVTDRKRAELALRESEERYRLLAENINDLVCLHAPDGRYLYVSPSSATLLGYRPEELIGCDPYDFFHPEDRDRIRTEAHQSTLVGMPSPITYRMRQKSGRYVWLETLTKPILSASGEVVQLQTTSRNVSLRVQVQEQLRHDAMHDTLTGLPNRNLLLERLELAMHRAKRTDRLRFAVLFLDLDRFKVINDSLGHLAGDRLLIEIARMLRALLRETDVTARIGGDEFVILLEEVGNLQEVIRIAERILAEMRTPFSLDDREVFVSASIGIVWGTPEYTHPSALLRDADIAMYRAKNGGKGRYEIFDREMHAQAVRRLHLENDLRQALERQELQVYYQPIVSLRAGRLKGFETLARWQHPTEGFIPPTDFIAIAEEIGAIVALDRLVLQTACQQLAQWRATLPQAEAVGISVNLSAQDLWRDDLPAEIDRILSQTNLPPDCLTLEITESMLVDNIEGTIELLGQLKTRGIQIAIDDFGTGYSSLSYLHRLTVDILKVDRSFVSKMQESDRNRRIVETIVMLANNLGLEVTAEGVETEGQAALLQQLGCTFAQGYLFARPQPPDRAAAILSAEHVANVV